MNRIMIDMAATGRNIELLLKESKMSVSRLTGLMGLSTTNAVYKWIRGETLPTPDNPVALSAVLGVAMDEIIIRKMEFTTYDMKLRQREAGVLPKWVKAEHMEAVAPLTALWTYRKGPSAGKAMRLQNKRVLRLGWLLNRICGIITGLSTRERGR